MLANPFPPDDDPLLLEFIIENPLFLEEDGGPAEGFPNVDDLPNPEEEA